jgi:hypothetical protein
MAIQSNGFKSILNKKATGISKARVKPTEFLETEIPIPSLSTQKELLRRYNDSICKAQELEQKAVQIEEGVKYYIIDLLGATTKRTPKGQEGKYKYWNLVHFIDVAEWGVDIILKKQKAVSYRERMRVEFCEGILEAYTDAFSDLKAVLVDMRLKKEQVQRFREKYGKCLKKFEKLLEKYLKQKDKEEEEEAVDDQTVETHSR